MITEQDLQAAIAECKGQRNPTANTCIKLAAFYILMDHMFPTGNEMEQVAYSYQAPPVIDIDSDSEFAHAVNGRTSDEIMPIMDEAMEALQVLHPAFYKSIIRKIEY